MEEMGNSTCNKETIKRTVTIAAENNLTEDDVAFLRTIDNRHDDGDRMYGKWGDWEDNQLRKIKLRMMREGTYPSREKLKDLNRSARQTTEPSKRKIKSLNESADGNQKEDKVLKELGEIDESKFRLQNIMIHLTYSTHLDFDAWMTFMKSSKQEKGPGFPISEYSFVHETGDSEYPHTHILIRFVKAAQSTNQRIFDFEGIHPHIKRVATRKHWDNIIKYHEKQGKPITDLKRCSLTERIQSYETLDEAMVHECTKPGDANGIDRIYNMKNSDRPAPPEDIEEWCPWQQEIIDLVKTKADSRTIEWIYDPHGGAGKTSVGQYIAGERLGIYTTIGSARDLGTQLGAEIEKGECKDAVIFNFPRQMEDHRIYTGLEQVKDGSVAVPKYKSRMIHWGSRRPHVIVMANYFPNIESVSLDRWRIRPITNGREFTHVAWGDEICAWIEKHYPGIGLEEGKRLYVESLDKVLVKPPPKEGREIRDLSLDPVERKTEEVFDMLYPTKGKRY